jgi:hypothetical protein
MRFMYVAFFGDVRTRTVAAAVDCQIVGLPNYTVLHP